MPTTYASHPDYGYDRDFKGYGEKGLAGLKWPNNAKIAVSFVINYEEVNPTAQKETGNCIFTAKTRGILGRRALCSKWRWRLRDKPPRTPYNTTHE